MDRGINRLIILLTIILILMLAYLLLTEQGHQIIRLIQNRVSNKHEQPAMLYTCAKLSRQNVTFQSATCKDCMYYPVDKTHRLSATYAPYVVSTYLPGGGELVPPAVPPLRNLFAALRGAGHSPLVTSAYRSYQEQVTTFNGWFYREWQHTGNIGKALANAERYSAWPGQSEHQLGTTVDVNCRGCVAFDTKDPRNVELWEFLAQNAHLYGFVISYPREMEASTGYQYEPWHIRYVGVDAATTLYNQGYAQGNGVCLNALLKTMQE